MAPQRRRQRRHHGGLEAAAALYALTMAANPAKSNSCVENNTNPLILGIDAGMVSC